MTENSELKEKLLSKLTLQFYRLSLNFSLEYEEIQIMTWSLQQQFFDATVNSDLNKKYPLSCKFTKQFLKKVLNYLEPVQEVHDEFYTLLCDAINNENNTNAFYYRHYIIDNDLKNVITMKETNNIVVNGTTGMRTWEAALMLADWALCNKDLFYGKRVLELGSGIGFTGITVAKFCNTQSILLTDCHSDVLSTICANITINFPDLIREFKNDGTLFRNNQHCLGVINLDWNEIDNLPKNEVPDIVIGADIVYDPSILKPLCNVLRVFSERNKQLQIYICSVIRNENTIKSFLESLDTNGFAFEKVVTRSVHLEWDQNIKTCFVRIIPKLNIGH